MTGPPSPRPFFLVGLTGGIASGKSTVSRQLAALGCRLVDADVLAREVVAPGEPAWRAIVEEFGPDVARPDGQLDRKRLGALVFADPARRKVLEGITHPAIAARRQAILDAWAAEGFDGLVVLDIPLLIEVGAAAHVDRVVLVYAEPEVQLARLMGRDGFDRAEAERRVASQMPLAEKVRHAHFVDRQLRRARGDRGPGARRPRRPPRGASRAADRGRPALVTGRPGRTSAGAPPGHGAPAGGRSASTSWPIPAWRRGSWTPSAPRRPTSCARSAPGRAP